MSATPESHTSDQLLALLQRFSQAWNQHDIDTLMACMADDCVFHATAGPELQGTSYVGREAVRQGFALAWKNCPDARWLDAEHFVQFALVSGSGRPQVVDAFHFRLVARDHHPQTNILDFGTVVQQVSQLELIVFNPVNRRQQHQMAKPFMVAQVTQ